MDSISKRVRAARQHMSYTQKELSEKCGISQQSINKLEMAKTSSPRKNALKSLSQALDVPKAGCCLEKDRQLGLSNWKKKHTFMSKSLSQLLPP